MATVEIPIRKVTATLTCAAAGNYDAGDVLSASASAGVGTATTLSNLAGANGEVVTIYGVSAVCSEDSVAFRARLHFFDAAPAAAEVEMDDAAAFAITTSTNWIGDLDLPAFADKGSVAVTQDHSPRLFLKATNGTRDLYMVVETLDAETNETAGMTIRFDFYVG